uniref:Uncharacterized protein n=1 Tax=viral metagenome TaxID=1070528 RepID=A0A6C0HIB0_9ZZZZ
MSTFHTYSNNTKSIYIITSVALLLIVISTIAPLGLSMFKTILVNSIALALVSYALYKNCVETNKLVKSLPDLFKNERLTGIRNNVILSYLLCTSLLVLILYFIWGALSI